MKAVHLETTLSLSHGSPKSSPTLKVIGKSLKFHSLNKVKKIPR